MNYIGQNSEQQETDQLSTPYHAYDVLPLVNYYMDDTTGYNWIEINSSGTLLELEDYDSTSISLPFTFPFYDSLFSTIYVSSNGWFSFNNTNPTNEPYYDFPIENFEFYYAIALFGHYLSPNNNIYYESLVNPNRLIIEYHNIYSFHIGDIIGSFEAILFENGTIIFQYDYITDDSADDYSTVGIQYGLDDIHFNSYSGLSSSTNDLAIRFTYPPEDHDVLSTFEMPSTVLLGTTASIDITIGNYGVYNENDVTGELYINDIMVADNVYTTLSNKTSAIFSYPWQPTVAGVYNITTIAYPVLGETYLDNNVYTEFVEVIESLITFNLGDYICMNKSTLAEPTKLWMNFTYDSFFDPYYVTVTNSTDPYPYLEVNIQTREIVNGGVDFIHQGSFYPGQIETTIDVGDTIAYLDSYGTVEETVWYDWNGFPLEAWKINLNALGIEVYHHKETGVWLYFKNKISKEEYFMVNTSLISSQRPDHDLFISLGTHWNGKLEHQGYFPPGETTQLIASIYNWGLSDEAEFTASIWINNVNVWEEYFWYGPYVLHPGETIITMPYDWIPEVGIYNITVSVTPVPGESRITDNKRTEFVSVHEELISFELGEYIKLYHTDQDQWYNYTYDSILPDGHHVNVSTGNGEWLIVNLFTRLITNTSSGSETIAFNETYYPGQIETNVLIGDTIEFYYLKGEITESVLFEWNNRQYEAWKIDINWIAQMFVYCHKETGICVYIYQHYEVFTSEITLNETNMIDVYDHDIQVLSQVPSFSPPDETINLQCEVANYGLNVANDIIIEYWIEDTMEHTTTISSLAVLESTIISFDWTPSTEGTYNITIFAVPIVGETYLKNNKWTTIVTISEPALKFDIGDFITMDIPMTITYDHFIDDSHVNVTLESGGSPIWLSVNIFTRIIEDTYEGAEMYLGLYWFGQIETDITIDDSINWYMYTGVVKETVQYEWNGKLLEVWNVSLSLDDFVYFHKKTGIWVYYLTPEVEFSLIDTNMINFPIIELTYPNGGEKLTGIVSIIWNANDPDGDPLTYKIYYTTGTSWTQIAIGITTTSYDWDTTSVADGTSYKIRIVANDSELITEDESDDIFTIDHPEAPQIIVTYPNGSETLAGFVTITWDAIDPDGDPLTYTLYWTTGTSWTQIATGITTTSYDWDTTSVADGTSYKIRVVASDGTFEVEDESDETFSIDNVPSGTTTPTTTTTTTATTTTITTTEGGASGFEIFIALSMILVVGLASKRQKRKKR